MDTAKLVGRRVKVCASDLFGEPVDAVVLAEDVASKSLQLRFTQPVVVDAQRFDFAVSKVRLRRDSLDTLLSVGTVGCALTCVPPNRMDPARPFDTSWWRGGAAAIADLVLV